MWPFGNASPKLKRNKYSTNSLEALELVENAEHGYEDLVQEIESIEDKMEDKDGLDEASKLVDKLAKLYGDIDKFQQQKVDTISSAQLKSGKEQVKARRKLLTNKLEVLDQRTKALRERLRRSAKAF